MSIAKMEALKIIERLPDQATWEDIMYEMYVKSKIGASVEAAEAGRVVSHEDVRKRFLSK